MASQLVVILCLAMWCMAFTPGGADHTCQWEERAGIALQQLQSPAVVLREYSDVTSSRDCYQKCCDLEVEGCNVAVYLSYDTEVVCMNVKCVPFDNCKWGPYAASIAALNDVDSSFASVTLGGASNTTSATTNTSTRGNGTSANQAGSNTTEVDLTTNVPVDANTTTTTAASVNTNAAGSITTSEATDDNNNALNFDKKQPLGGNTNDGKVDENGLASQTNVNNGRSDSNFEDGGAGKTNRTSSVYLGGSSHVNYTVSITIGVLTCVAFLLIMYVAAKKFHLFQDRSKYSRLLENPEQYADNFNASEFED